MTREIRSKLNMPLMWCLLFTLIVIIDIGNTYHDAYFGWANQLRQHRIIPREHIDTGNTWKIDVIKEGKEVQNALDYYREHNWFNKEIARQYIDNHMMVLKGIWFKLFLMGLIGFSIIGAIVAFGGGGNANSFCASQRR